MNRKTDMTEEEYQELVRNIEEHSQYQMKPSLPKKWMTVTEMGDLLGLKKTDRYWLVHKNVFESKKIAGKMRVNIGSFEKWYANQVKYRKITGEEPGQELNEWSFSARDIAHLLGITEAVAYDLIKRENSLIGKRTVEILSEEGFDSPKQIQRYLKIADMIPEMLEKLDYGLISFHPTFEIAFLKPNEQRMLLDAMDYAQSAPSVSQAQRIKKLSQMNKLTLEAMTTKPEEVEARKQKEMEE